MCMEQLITRYSKLGWTRGEIEQLTYALAEQLHVNSCAVRGFSNHASAKPDVDVAVAMLVGLFDGGRYLERIPGE